MAKDLNDDPGKEVDVYALKLFLHGTEVRELALESGREYTFGRAATCDVPLEEQPGLSRVHFRLVEEDAVWTMHVVSKFGHVTFGGQPVKQLQLEPNSVFKFAGYDFRFVRQASDVIPMPTETPAEEPQVDEFAHAAGSEFTGSSANLPALSSQGDFDGNDEATRVATKQTGVAYLRIVHVSGRETTIKLDGPKWIAGREEGSTIQLDDRKASRRQFELSVSAQGNFIRDLGSSNGTQLNGMPLAPDELKPLRSGDVIQVGRLSLHFEIRDPYFEKRLAVVPQNVAAASPMVVQPAYEMIHYPVPSGPGGAVRVDSGSHGYSPYELPGSVGTSGRKKKKNPIFILIVAMIGGLTLWLALDEPPKPAKKAPTKAAATNGDAFSRLGPQAQQQVRETYILARNLLMQQGKRELAMEQLTRLHQILPEGYENSRGMEDEIRAQVEQERAANEAKRELEIAAANKRIVEKNLRDCERIANSATEVESLRTCLAPTYERDPQNPMIANYMGRVEARISARQAKATSARNYSGLVAKGRALFERAQGIEKRGDSFAAMDAYKKHISAPFPDPDGLREVSRKNLAAIQGGLASKTAQYVKAAEEAYAKQDYKTAITNINRVKNIDPGNQRAAELNANIRRELTVKLREIYENSIINEGLGKIDDAKADWKKILDLDHQDGEYYRRARNKMKAFGGM